MPSFHPDTSYHLGLDVHKDSISAGILQARPRNPRRGEGFNVEESVPPPDRAFPRGLSGWGDHRSAGGHVELDPAGSWAAKPWSATRRFVDDAWP